MHRIADANGRAFVGEIVTSGCADIDIIEPVDDVLSGHVADDRVKATACVADLCRITDGNV